MHLIKTIINFQEAESFSIDDEIWDELIDQWKHEKQYVKYTGNDSQLQMTLKLLSHIPFLDPVDLGSLKGTTTWSL